MEIIQGDCLEVLKTLPENSVDGIVTDPPYELGFMGKSWDSTGIANNVEMWKECLRVLKPGGHLLAFSGTRTYHRMASAIEDAGFEVRDMIEWVYGSGFPKSLNIGKAVDKLRGNEREEVEGGQIASTLGSNTMDGGKANHNYKYTKGTSEWEGWGTALKPAHEPICMARKPVLDVCCGPKGMWFDKNDARALYLDKRCEKHANNYPSGYKEMEIRPDIIGDFTDIKQPDNSFSLVVFDPPHINQDSDGEITKRYGSLRGDWKDELKKGFAECFRVLKPYGTLIFKWCEVRIPLKEILELTPEKPLFGHKSGKKMQTHWVTFMKIPREQSEEITPNHNPICMARKPLSEKTVAENCLKWGTGGINIDGSRVGTEIITQRLATVEGGKAIGGKGVGIKQKATGETTTTVGRFPANLIHDNSEEVRECFPETSKGSDKPRNRNTVGSFGMPNDTTPEYADSGNASRFFKSIIYQAKASKRERNMGCEGLEFTRHADRNIDDGVGGDNPRNRTNTPKQNFHPTVKPVALMEYLINMVTREGQIVLDPFMGSGSTGMACKNLGREFIGIELEPEYIEIAKARIG